VLLRSGGVLATSWNMGRERGRSGGLDSEKENRAERDGIKCEGEGEGPAATAATIAVNDGEASAGPLVAGRWGRRSNEQGRGMQSIRAREKKQKEKREVG